MSRAESSRIEGAPGAGAAAVTAAGPGHYRLDSNARAFLKYVGGMAAALAPLAIAYGDYYWLNILTYTYLFAGLAASWNIIGGFGGQFSLGHGVFFAIGAYFTAIFYADHGISPWLTILPAALVSAAVASLISWPTFRLKGPFFAIATMAFNEVAMVFANYFSGVTGGPRGILIPFKAGFTNMIFAERWKYAVLMFAYAALVVGLSVVLWSFCSWLIPILLALGVWRYVLRRQPLTYDAGLWSVVFPGAELWIAAAVWLTVFLDMVRSSVRALQHGSRTQTAQRRNKGG